MNSNIIVYYNTEELLEHQSNIIIELYYDGTQGKLSSTIRKNEQQRKENVIDR